MFVFLFIFLFFINFHLPVPGHLAGGVQVHDVLEELPVEEGHPRLQAPGHGRLVGPQAVVLVQVVHFPDTKVIQHACTRIIYRVFIKYCFFSLKF